MGIIMSFIVMDLELEEYICLRNNIIFTSKDLSKAFKFGNTDDIRAFMFKKGINDGVFSINPISLTSYSFSIN